MAAARRCSPLTGTVCLREDRLSVAIGRESPSVLHQVTADPAGVFGAQLIPCKQCRDIDVVEGVQAMSAARHHASRAEEEAGS